MPWWGIAIAVVVVLLVGWWWWFWLAYMLPADDNLRLERRKKWLGY